MSWDPILDGELRTRALDIAGVVAGELVRNRDGHAFGLSQGAAGFAVALAYIASVTDRAELADAASAWLDDALAAAAEAPPTPSLYAGASGVAWAIDHLDGRLFDAAGADLNEDVDHMLVELVARPRWTRPYDLVSGLAGVGVYGLERRGRGRGRELVELVVERLAELAERRGEHIAWFTPPSLVARSHAEDWPAGYYNLGLAHGIPGVITVLAGAHAAGIAQDRIAPLLDGAVAFMLARRDATTRAFDFWVGPDLCSPRTRRRAAWCYGDAGVGIALLLAARVRERPTWRAAALDILRGIASWPIAEVGVVDAGICHGSAGLAHVLMRGYHMTGDPALRELATVWLRRTLAFHAPAHGFAGFSAITSTDARGEPDAGLIGGAAGIAAVLAAAAGTVEPAWDRMLLVSL